MWKCEKGEKQYKACKEANADYCSDCPHGVKENIEEDIKILEKFKNIDEFLKKDIKNKYVAAVQIAMRKQKEENEELKETIGRQQDMIKNALYIINKNEKEKIDQTWLYNFDKCAIPKGDNK